MSNGRYSDDLREDSLFRDDEMRLLEELEKESNEGKRKAPIGSVVLFIVIAGLFIWWFFFG